MTDVLPARNLPGEAENWGRAVEDGVESTQVRGERSSQSLRNSMRSSTGQLATLARSVREVSYRAAETIQVPDMTVSGSATSEPYPRTDTTLTFSATPGTRYAQFTVSGRVSSTASIGEKLYVYGILRGEVISAAWAQPFRPMSTPSEWVNNVPLYSFGLAVTLPDTPPEITLRIVRAADAFSPGSSTLTFQNIVATLTRDGAI